MADRNVVNTATLDTLRTTYNSTAADVGDIASVTGASGVIASATDIVEAITLMNTEVTGIKTGATTFESQITFEGATDDAYETTLAVTDPTADRTITFPDASGTVATTAATQTFTNKTIDLGNNTLTGSLAEFNTALQSVSFTSLTGSETLTNKTLTAPVLTSAVLDTAVSGSAFLDEDGMDSNSATKLASQQSIKAYVDAQVTAEDLDIAADSGSNIAIDLDSEVLTLAGGTGIASVTGTNSVTFNIDSTVTTLTGTQTLTNKTLTSPTINSPTITALTATALNLTDASIIFEGATADAYETTLTVVDPTADRVITIPNETGTLITSASAATNAFSIALATALG
jgi:hypothetical protein